MKLIIVESPYAGDTAAEIESNLAYMRRCMAYCLGQGAAPFASHGLYTQDGVLDDLDPAQRALGIKAGFAWGEVATERWFFVDLGVTDGMIKGWREVRRLNQSNDVISLDDALDWVDVRLAGDALARGQRWTP